MSQNQICHKGIISKVTTGEVSVKIVSQSACSACKTKSVCSMSEAKEKEILIPITDDVWKEGDEVNVIISEKMGAFAVIVAYILPFVGMMVSMFIARSYQLSELYMGLFVVIFLSSYYSLLYRLRKKISRRIHFVIKALN